MEGMGTQRNITAIAVGVRRVGWPSLAVPVGGAWTVVPKAVVGGCSYLL